MHLTEDDDMVGALAAECSNQPFGDAILPRGHRRDRLITDTHSSQPARHCGAVDLISVADEVTWGFIPGKCFGDLPCNPLGGRMRCYVDPNKLSAGQPDDDEDVEKFEGDGWNHEEVHGGDFRSVVTKEGEPSLGGGGRSLDHVFGHARLSDLETELQQFTVDSWSAP